MAIICTQSPAKNTSGGVRRERENLGGPKGEHGKKDWGRWGGLLLLREASEGWEEQDQPQQRCSKFTQHMSAHFHQHPLASDAGAPVLAAGRVFPP